jgi:hypothetical protein
VQSQVSKTIYGVKSTYNFVEKISLNLLILPIDKNLPQISSKRWKKDEQKARTAISYSRSKII